MMVYRLSNTMQGIQDILGNVQGGKIENVLGKIDRGILDGIGKNIEGVFHVDIGTVDSGPAVSSNRDRSLYFLKDKVSIVVDLARLSLARVGESVAEITQKYKSLLNQSVRIVHSRKHGYTLKMLNQSQSIQSIERILGENILLREDSGRYMIVQTEALKRLSLTRREAEGDIFCESKEYIQRTVDIIIDKIEILFRVNRLVSSLDVLLQFSQYALRCPVYSIPRLDDRQTLDGIIVKGARDTLHMHNGNMSVNDYFLSPVNPVMLVTGDHSSGKTTYMLNLCRLCILAYMGCPLPVSSVSIPLFNRLIVNMRKIGNIESMRSTFGNELTDIDNILEGTKKLAEKKLMVLDSVLSGSSHTECMAHMRSLVDILLSRSCLLMISSNDPGYISLSREYGYWNNIHINRIGHKATLIEEWDNEDRGNEKGVPALLCPNPLVKHILESNMQDIGATLSSSTVVGNDNAAMQKFIRMVNLYYKSTLFNQPIQPVKDLLKEFDIPDNRPQSIIKEYTQEESQGIDN